MSTVTISKSQYEELLKCQRYVSNHREYVRKCPKCGEYNRRECVCAYCGYDE